MSSLKELLLQRELLNAQIEQTRQSELAEALTKVHAMIQEYGLTQQDIFPSSDRRISRATSSKVPPKYRNPLTGATWTGRGKPPRWIEGKDRSMYLIA